MDRRSEAQEALKVENKGDQERMKIRYWVISQITSEG